MDKILEGTDWLEGAKKANFAPDPFAGMDVPDEPKKSPMKLVGKKTKKTKKTVKKDPTKKLF